MSNLSRTKAVIYEVESHGGMCIDVVLLDDWM